MAFPLRMRAVTNTPSVAIGALLMFYGSTAGKANPRAARTQWLSLALERTDARPKCGRPLQNQLPPTEDGFVEASRSRVLRDGEGMIFLNLNHPRSQSQYLSRCQVQSI